MRRPNDESVQIRQLIEDYVSQNGVTDTRKIADYVEANIGMRPSTATVSKILQDLSYLPHRQPSFVWRHNPPR
jgi:hypothetical protein